MGRWALPTALLLVEYLSLSFVVDLTGRAELVRWAELYRLAAPVAIGAVAAGWLISRSMTRPGAEARSPPAPAGRPWTGLLGNLAAFAGALAVAAATLGPSAPVPAPPWSLPALLSLGVLAALLALSIAAPLRWLAGQCRRSTGTVSLAFGLGLVTWWVAGSFRGVWAPLSTATLRAVGAILRLSGGEVLIIPAEQVVGLDGFEVEIARVCSGVDGIGLFLLFEGIWLALARGRLRFPRALVLLPAGAVVAFAANALRVATLIAVGAAGHEAIALGGLHSKLGWILSVALALGGVAIAERAAWLRRAPEPRPASVEMGGVPPVATTYLAPLLAALSTALVTGIWARGLLDRWYVARILAAAVALFAVRRGLPSLAPSRSWVPVLVGAGVAVAWILGAGGEDSGLARELASLGTTERWAWIAVRVVGSTTVIPVVEELAFRGLLLPWIVSPDVESVPPRAWTWPAVLASSLAFGAIHSNLWLGTMAGVAFAFARLWRGRLGDAVVAHAVANAAVAVAVLAGGRWGLWG